MLLYLLLFLFMKGNVFLLYTSSSIKASLHYMTIKVSIVDLVRLQVRFTKSKAVLQPLKFRWKCVGKIITEANLKFYILPWQGCGIYFADAYGKMQLFALATILASLSIYLSKLLKLLLDKNGMRSHTHTCIHFYFMCCR